MTPEDKSGDLWVACDELSKVVVDGAEESARGSHRGAEAPRGGGAED